MTEKADDKPYEPKYKGFDEDATRRSQATAERSRELEAGKGEHLDEAYVEEGPQEAADRLGWKKEEVGESVERAKEQGGRSRQSRKD